MINEKIEILLKLTSRPRNEPYLNLIDKLIINNIPDDLAELTNTTITSTKIVWAILQTETVQYYTESEIFNYFQQYFNKALEFESDDGLIQITLKVKK